MKRSQFSIGLLSLALFAGLTCLDALALRQRGDYPWKSGRATWQDKEMFDAIGQSWYLPVGPTGIRSQITTEHPQYFTVRYVFKDSPAAGKVAIGDIIVGANGTMLTRSHSFAKGSKSWDGPMVDMAKLIEDSQGRDGKLALIIWPGGKKGAQKTVHLQIAAVGRFSPTFPYNCKRSDALLDGLCDILASDFDRRDAAKGGITPFHMILALMASGDAKYDPVIKPYIAKLVASNPDACRDGKSSWGNAYSGIILGEYYKRTGDKSLLPILKKYAQFYQDAMNYGRGAYSHRPTPAMWTVNSKGYGAMAAPAGLSMLAMGVFKSAGVPYSEHTRQSLHQSYLRSATPESMSVVYCFPRSPDHAAITLADPTKARTDDGPGFKVPTGMKGIGKYTIGWPTPKENRQIHLGPAGTDTAWVEAEKETNEVYMGFKNNPASRIVVRALKLPEPTQSYDTRKACAQAPVGLGALAHAVGTTDPSWKYLAEHCGNACALGYGTWFDGHASAGMHHLWVGLGASQASEEHYRAFMDGIKWWFIMQQTHDGSYLNCPNRDRPTGANKNYGPHTMASANAALILSVPRRVLQITGAR